MLATLGGTYDAVSHHGAVQVTGIGTTPRLRHTLEGLGVSFSQYQGPSSVQTALLDAARAGASRQPVSGATRHTTSRRCRT